MQFRPDLVYVRGLKAVVPFADLDLLVLDGSRQLLLGLHFVHSLPSACSSFGGVFCPSYSSFCHAPGTNRTQRVCNASSGMRSLFRFYFGRKIWRDRLPSYAVD